MLRRHGADFPFRRKTVTADDAKALAGDIKALNAELLVLGLDLAGITPDAWGQPLSSPQTQPSLPPDQSQGSLHPPDSHTKRQTESEGIPIERDFD